MKDQDLEKIVRGELKNIMSSVIWRNDDGSYEIFGKYLLIPEKQAYTVFCYATEVGNFTSTKTALAWCIADKYKNYNLARQIKLTDEVLHNLSNDIFVRAAVANRAKKVQFKEDIETKIENKIIRKKELEQQMVKYINLTKYLQQKEFDNETARFGRATTNKTSR